MRGHMFFQAFLKSKSKTQAGSVSQFVRTPTARRQQLQGDCSSQWRRGALFCGLVFGALLLTQALVGCGSAPLAQADANAGTPAATSGTGSQATDTPAATAVPTSQPSSGQTTPAPQSTVPPLVLHGPTNFVLKLPFTFSVVNGATSDDSGATTPIDSSTIKKNVTQELQHLLFVVDSSNRIKVYSQGTAPVSAQLTYNADGSAAISYTQKADSEAGTVTLLFAGVLSQQQISGRF